MAHTHEASPPPTRLAPASQRHLPITPSQMKAVWVTLPASPRPPAKPPELHKRQRTWAASPARADARTSAIGDTMLT